MIFSYDDNEIILKVHSCKYMITSAQISNTEIFGFIAVLVFKLLNLKGRLPFKKMKNFTGQLL